MNKGSSAQRKAVAAYNASHYDRIELRVMKGKKDEIKAAAARNGETLNSFINNAIDAAIPATNF